MAIRTQIVVCGGTGCMSSHSKEIKEEFEKVLKELGLDKEVVVFQSGCFGLCQRGPVVIVYPDETFYGHMTVKDVEALCKEHILKGDIFQVVPSLRMKCTTEKSFVEIYPMLSL